MIKYANYFVVPSLIIYFILYFTIDPEHSYLWCALTAICLLLFVRLSPQRNIFYGLILIPKWLMIFILAVTPLVLFKIGISYTTGFLNSFTGISFMLLGMLIGTKTAAAIIKAQKQSGADTETSSQNSDRKQ